MDPEVSVEDALKLLRENCPRDMLIHGEAITRNMERIKAKKFEHKYFMEDFLRGPLIATPGKSIFIRGGSNLGKTHYACAHFQNPLLVCDIDDLKRFSVHLYDGIVFDDMSFTHIPPEKVIHLVDQEFTRTIRCRHSNAIIPAGVRKIFTHNNRNPFFDESGQFPPTAAQKIAIARRLDCYNVPLSLFRVSISSSVLVVSEALLDDDVNRSEVYHCDGQ